MSFLSVSGINKRIGRNSVISNVSFTQKPFQKIAIAGETGSGKSTLLKIIAGLVQPDSGEVLFKNERVAGPEEKLLPGYSRIAYLSQHFELRNNYKVEEVLEMANKMHNLNAENIYEVCRISHLLKRRTDQLSGGEKQRIATAKLLISLPELLLLDEPYSNLDIIHRNVLKSVINDISGQLKITCMMISHDPSDSLSWADEIIVMREGNIIQRGTPQEIYHKPINEYTASLFGNYNLIKTDHNKIYEEWSGIVPVGKKLLARPESFKIVSKEKSHIAGTVKKVSFFGSHYEIQVSGFENDLTIKTEVANVVEGDTIYLKLAFETVSFI